MVKVMKVIDVELYNRLMELLKNKTIPPQKIAKPRPTVDYSAIFDNVIKAVKSRKKSNKKKRRK